MNPNPSTNLFISVLLALVLALVALVALPGCEGCQSKPPPPAATAATDEEADAPKGSAPALNRVGAIMLWTLIPLTILSFTPWGSLMGWASIAATGLVGVTLMEAAAILHSHPWIGWLLVAAVPAMFLIEALELKSGTRIVQRVRGLFGASSSPASD